MILVDTSGAYALIDKRDKNHKRVASFFLRSVGQEVFAISLPVLTEAWYLLDSRVNSKAADSVLRAVTGKGFHLLDMDARDVAMARDINEKYEDA